MTPTTDLALADAQIEGLTAMQSAFVHEYVANGGQARAAAVKAGYAKTSAHVTASRMMRQPAVIRAIYETTVGSLGSHLPAALGRIVKLSGGAKSEHVQLKASTDLLDRAGMSAPKQHRVSGTVNVNIDLS